jgi:hypothetical protein
VGGLGADARTTPHTHTHTHTHTLTLTLTHSHTLTLTLTHTHTGVGAAGAGGGAAAGGGVGGLGADAGARGPWNCLCEGFVADVEAAGPMFPFEAELEQWDAYGEALTARDVAALDALNEAEEDAMEVVQRCKSCESWYQGLARRDRNWSLNDGRIHNPSNAFGIVPLSRFVPRGFGCVHHSIAILYHEVRFRVTASAGVEEED